MGSKKTWVLRKQNKELVKELAAALRVKPVVAQILVNRGIKSVESGRKFFQCELADTPDPFLMLGMDKAVARIERALTHREKIVVYGDYDVDGQTATALLVLTLRELSQDPATIMYYVPDRVDEGYGLNRDAVTRLSQRASLLITVDCGISSRAEVEYACGLGLDVIVTDHHEPGPDLPAAVAILNPKQGRCPYPFKGLAGVGVAFKLVQGLGVPLPKLRCYLDLVALGTVADLVPLQEENRAFVKHGLKQMEQTNSSGLRALLEVAEVDKPTATDLGFRLGPRLNAAGRLGDPTRGVRLLLTQDPSEAKELAWELNQENAKRQELETDVLEAAIAVIERHRLDKRSALVVWGEDWHQGVVGIVASRLVDRYYLPSVVISLHEGQGTASARSIAGLDLYQTLSDCAPLLTKFGGHAMAAGLSLPQENFLDFQHLFEALCATRISPEDYVPKLFIDGTTKLGEVTTQLVEELSMLEPHGFGNPGPMLQAEVAVLRTRRVGAQNRHLQLTVHDATGQATPAIAFGFGEQEEQVQRHAESLAVAFVPGINEWRNERTIQLDVREWEARGETDNYVRRWMVDLYPWRLGASFYQSMALHMDNRDLKQPKTSKLADLRGTWDKVGTLRARRSHQESTLILVNTPAAVLEICRHLRIKIAHGTRFIGFEHEWLTVQERDELMEAPPSWLVSTGFGLEDYRWPSVWLWEPPLTQETLALWSGLVQDGGELVGIYGPQDVRWLQSQVKANYPDRQGLARIYTMLKGSDSGKIDLATAHQQLENLGLLGALPVAMGVFSELGLWKVQEGTIVYLPTPAQKLDLEQTVLYNKVTKMRIHSAQYLKRCLERGFFQDGLEREN